LELDDFFFGTFFPAFRASESPIAIACFLLVTFAPEPLRSFPSLRSCIAFFTFLPAAFEYFRTIVASFKVIPPPVGTRFVGRRGGGSFARTAGATECSVSSKGKLLYAYLSKLERIAVGTPQNAKGAF
jgi:hypothetical protein